MTWGNQLIANDAEGGYYRFDYQSRQWLADVGIDEVRSVDSLGRQYHFPHRRRALPVAARLGGRRRGQSSAAPDGGTGWSLQGYVDHVNSWGTGRAQADYASTPEGTRHGAVSSIKPGRVAAGIALEHRDIDRAHRRIR